ncbi:glycosyltransferase family 4 protein [Thermaerobacter sp. PB12/4term]|uniref:glycosyltransferase family 4 protein n=1 Tax=Thermaerobacter sp. PB12/4term TaxID=2293838 RepID=UPI0013146302|nr:glycosyltransferase family 4 protein [Thermaerobacter sp. PB12/4term]QIA26695.1 glycosyltransferase family 4 protein [Thermaerobacter sp. PB12/4term]
MAPDPRVARVARTLARAGFRVTVVAWDREGAFDEWEGATFGRIIRLRAGIGARRAGNEYGPRRRTGHGPGQSRGRKRPRLRRSPYGTGLRKLPAFLHWQWQLLGWLLRHRNRYAIIHACDFDTLTPSVILKFVYGKRVVYDIFDWYAETVRGLPAILRRGVARLDRWLLEKVDAVILADESRLPQLGKARPRRLEIVYNTPDWDPDDVIRGLPSRRGLRVAYIGLLQADRGLLELLEVIGRHPEWVLDLGGFGAEEELIRDAAATLPNVRIQGRVPHIRYMEIYARADVVVVTYDPSLLNHRYSSPNKLFEAMRLGKPVVVAEGTGVDRLVKAWRLGYVVPYGDTIRLEAALEDAAGWTREEGRAFAERVSRVYDQYFSWRMMEQRLLRVYKEMLKPIVAAGSSRESGSLPNVPDGGGEPQAGGPPE